MELILNSTEFLFNSTEISECFKKGLLCPNKTSCTKTGNESYDCVCNKGFHMVHGLNYTCEGETLTIMTFTERLRAKGVPFSSFGAVSKEREFTSRSIWHGWVG